MALLTLVRPSFYQDSVALLALAVASARAPSPVRARRLFLGTLAYLPTLLGALVAGAIR